jgi:hypothetical protein
MHFYIIPHFQLGLRNNSRTYKNSKFPLNLVWYYYKEILEAGSAVLVSTIYDHLSYSLNGISWTKVLSSVNDLLVAPHDEKSVGN